MEALRLIHYIHLIRDQKVMLDADLAIIYGVSTKQLNQAVKRNAARFPEDFMFQLTKEEWQRLRKSIAIPEAATDLRSQFVTSNELKDDEDLAEAIAAELNEVNWGGRRYAPYAFTEHGATMLASVLRSERAVASSIQVVRAFVRMRNLLLNQDELTRRLQKLEAGVEGNFQIVFDAINELMAEKAERAQRRRMIGFRRTEEEE